MCLICEELKKGSIAPWEARRNLKEMKDNLTQEHINEIVEYLDEEEREEDPWSPWTP